ncbi:hypothetical protein [Puniceibacterium sp. IMCC21224]|uniref:hypothetical protein n=1 Tax=Puniceibacterium sp. IMCC21224 TaxID=1618204 RepID=UPI00064DFC7C|nr:hypothetical protein [Puniceibacterium sp. IMCC21224]KMK68046.1 DNA alkylation repair enzyme [Puniceibacterium sp. IMCC21224]
MARGPDGKGGGAGFSLADQLFNADSIGQMAAEYAVLPGFDPELFRSTALAGMASRGLLERLDFLADCVANQLPQDFPAMAGALEAAMLPPLDPTRTDDDFGKFIHAVPGILAVRHGLEDHRDRALDLIYSATQRFSMEFYIRPFLNRWPDETLARLDRWVSDDNYHVRRLVSEGTRPRLPWARNITLDPLVPLRYLDALHGDPTRYVTRSVANHMNDISKIAPDSVVGRLHAWRSGGRQQARELDWMTRHALRTAVKRGEAPALALLGYAADAPVEVALKLGTERVAVGELLRFAVAVTGDADCAVIVDYRIVFARPDGRSGEKVFKLKTGKVKPGIPLMLEKAHRLKGDATTFRWHPGTHALVVQVNGVDRARTMFEVVPG